MNLKNWNRLTACALALIMSAGMTVTPALAESHPEAAAPAEAVAVVPTFYANSHDVKAVVMNHRCCPGFRERDMVRQHPPPAAC